MRAEEGSVLKAICICIFVWLFLFERSEFLIVTCKKKKTDSLCVCGCSANLLVLVLGRQIVYGQNTVYLCLSKYIVFENTHTHIATAASETEGVAAVSWIESWIESCV